MQHLAPDATAGSTAALLIRGGAVATLRFAGETDADALQVYFRGLSPRSRYNRLMGAASELPAGQLDAFTHLHDDGRFSVIATILVDGVERIIGEARYACDENKASVELGLSVADAWQGQGLGSQLLSNLQARAVALGAETLFGDTLRSNDAMQALARKAGFTFSPTPGDWKQVRFEKRIDGSIVIPGREQRELRANPESRDGAMNMSRFRVRVRLAPPAPRNDS